MRINQIVSYTILLIIISGCSSYEQRLKREKKYSFKNIIPYTKCSDPVKLIDETKGDVFLLKDLNNLSYSTAYTSIDTYHSSISDTIAKDSIRYLYANNINKLVGSVFSNVNMINDSLILKKSNNYIYKNTSNINRGKEKITASIKNLIQQNKNSTQQLFIEISSFYFNNEFNNSVTIFVFDLSENKLLYLDKLKYICDIRDYNSLEKVLSFGLLKLKENFE